MPAETASAEYSQSARVSYPRWPDCLCIRRRKGPVVLSESLLRRSGMKSALFNVAGGHSSKGEEGDAARREKVGGLS